MCQEKHFFSGPGVPGFKWNCWTFIEIDREIHGAFAFCLGKNPTVSFFQWKRPETHGNYKWFNWFFCLHILEISIWFSLRPEKKQKNMWQSAPASRWFRTGFNSQVAKSQEERARCASESIRYWRCKGEWWKWPLWARSSNTGVRRSTQPGAKVFSPKTKWNPKGLGLSRQKWKPRLKVKDKDVKSEMRWKPEAQGWQCFRHNLKGKKWKAWSWGKATRRNPVEQGWRSLNSIGCCFLFHLENVFLLFFISDLLAPDFWFESFNLVA